MADADDDATTAIRAYLPRLLIRRIAANPDLHLPDETCFAAAVAFVDVSGFTALSTSLADVHGREGGELLQKYINEYFEKMLAIVQAHGGDVVDFAGDAFVALWRGAPIWDLEQIAALKEERELLREAVHCCVHILCELDEYEVQAAGAATGRLRVHCGVAAGEATFLCLGGVAASQPPTAAGRNELQYTLCGSIVEEMGVATDAAQSGEVYLGAAAAGLLRLGDADGMAPLPDELDVGLPRGGGLQLRCPADTDARARLARFCSLRRGRVALTGAAPPPPLAPAAVRRLLDFLPAVVRDLVPSPPDEADAPAGAAAASPAAAKSRLRLLLTEHRPVTAVFLGLSGLGERPCEVSDLFAAQRAVLAVHKVATALRGAVL